MRKLVCLCLAIIVVSVVAEYDFHGLGGLHGLDGLHGLGASLYAPPILKSAPILQQPTYIKTIAPAPAPIIAHAPIIKAVAPAATSYATVTQFDVSHPAPFVKAIVAPQPIIKSFAIPAPLELAHGYSHYPH